MGLAARNKMERQFDKQAVVRSTMEAIFAAFPAVGHENCGG
jgi:hypothetical protein